MLLYQKIRRNLTDYGFVIMFRKSVAKVFSPLYMHRKYCIYMANIEDAVDRAFTSADFTFKILDKGDVSLIRQIAEKEEWLKGSIRKKIANGDLCLVALDGATVAGFNLVSLNQFHIPLLHYRRNLRKQEAFSDQISVMQSYRKRGLGTALRKHIFMELEKRNIKKLYGATQPDNIASIKLARTAGFRFIADVSFRRVLFLGWLHLKRARYTYA